jgi:hypothetical protein
MSCLNAQCALRPNNVESPIGVLIGLSTEDRIDDAAGVTCGPNVGATAAPHRAAQARAAQACASNAPAHKGRTAWSALSLLNARELTSFEGSSRWQAG